MKKLTIAVALASVLLLPLACNPDGGADCVYTAHTEKMTPGRTAEITKATTDNWINVLWSAGDKIKVFKSSELKAKDGQGTDFTLTGAAGTPSAQFTATGTGSYNRTKSYFIYPAGIVKSHDGTAVTLNLPATQKYVPESFSTEALAAVAVGSSKEEVGFKNLCGLLLVKIKCEQPVSISSLTIVTKAQEALWGEGTVEMAYKEGENPVLKMKAPASDDAKKVKLVCNPPAQLGTEATSFCFTLPAGVLAKGFDLYVNDDLYGTMQLAGTAGKNTILRSASRTPTTDITYSMQTFNPETTLRGIAIEYESAMAVLAPTATGTNSGWKVYWGDGASDNYAPMLTHTYANPSEKVVAFFALPGADQIVFKGLAGVSTIYINSL